MSAYALTLAPPRRRAARPLPFVVDGPGRITLTPIVRLSSQDQLLSAAAASVTGGYPSTPTNQNVLLAACYSTAAAGVTATGWTPLVTSAAGANNVTILALLGDGSTNSWTFGASGATVIRCELYEYSGLDTGIVTDGTNSAFSSSTVLTFQPGSITTTNANDLLIGVCAWNNTTSAWSIDSSFTLNLTDARCVSGDRIVSSTGTFNPAFSWTTSRTPRAAIAALKGASGGADAVLPAAINASGSWSATVTRRAAVTPAAIAASSTWSGAVASFDPVAPAAVTASGSWSATVTHTPEVAPAIVTSTGNWSAVVLGPTTAAVDEGNWNRSWGHDVDDGPDDHSAGSW